MLYVLSQKKNVLYALGNGATAICTTAERDYSKKKKKEEEEDTVGKIMFDNGCCEDIGLFSKEVVAYEILNEIWHAIKNAKGKDVFYEIPEYR